VAAGALTHRAVVASLPIVPRSVVQRFAGQYIAGPSLHHAISVTRKLQAAGRVATYDILAEEQKSLHEAHQLAREYEAVLERIAAERLPASLSVRMTGLGLQRDDALCDELLQRVVGRAHELGLDVTIDMEDSSTTTATLDAYGRLRAAGLDNVGIVLQAYLRRTRDDITALAPLAPRVRIVKGVWNEPLTVAFQDPESIRSSYLRMVERLLDAGSYVELATHDDWLMEESLELVRRAGYDGSRYECQMLHGVRAELGDVVVADGHRLRIYVPFGPHWHPYCIRRLQESPAMARHVVNDSVRRALRRA
jgi:proline dehydrogenase